MIATLNQQIAININNYVAQNQHLTEVIIGLAVYLQYFLLLFLVIFVLLKQKDRLPIVTFAIFTAFFARFFIKTPIIYLIEEARPYIRFSEIKLLIEPNLNETLQSFPSGHALFYFALAFVIYAKNKKWGSFFFLGAFLMGAGRVGAGVHFPLDILAGAILGVITAYILLRFCFKPALQRMFTISNFLNNRFFK